jgi:hypothetical protein
MIKQIRSNIFETNSSSTHVLSWREDVRYVEDKSYAYTIPVLNDKQSWIIALNLYNEWINEADEEFDMVFPKYMYVLWNLIINKILRLHNYPDSCMEDYIAIEAFKDKLIKAFKSAGKDVVLNIEVLKDKSTFQAIEKDLIAIRDLGSWEVDPPKCCDPTYIFQSWDNIVEFILNPHIAIMQIDSGDINDTENPDDNAFGIKTYQNFYKNTKKKYYAN